MFDTEIDAEWYDVWAGCEQSNVADWDDWIDDGLADVVR